MNFLRKILLGITGLLLIAVVSVIFFRIRLIDGRGDITKAGIVFNSVSGLLTVFDDSTNRTRLIRLSDGKEQEFRGAWGVNYISPTRVAVFGQFEELSEKHNLFLFDGMGGRQLDISKLPGVITHVASNPNQTYLLITGINDKEVYSCVVDIMAPVFNCRDIVTELLGYEKNTAGPFIAWWNPEKQHELVIIRGENAYERFVMDMWNDERPRSVNETAIEHLLQKFESQKSTIASSMYLIKKTGPLLRVTDKKTGEWFSVFIAPWSRVFQVTPDAVVILGKQKAEVISLRQKKQFYLFDINKDTIIKTYFGEL